MLTDQATVADTITGRRQPPESLPAVRMTNGAGEGIGGIGGGRSGKLEQANHHALHLLFGRFTLPNDRLLDLQGRVFGDRQTGVHQSADRRSARLSEQEGRLRIDIDEDFFDSGLRWRIGGNYLADAGKERSQTLGQTLLRLRFDAAAGHINQAVSLLLNHAEAGHAQSRINAQNARRGHTHSGVPNHSSMTAVV